jgi:two-component system, chemotaxis family, protein-glutamate methylesterase/glutaminase
MGSDGVQGMLALKKAGAHTIAQNEDTCVVFGMPREAIRQGAVDRVLALPEIPAALLAESRRCTP